MSCFSRAIRIDLLSDIKGNLNRLFQVQVAYGVLMEGPLMVMAFRQIFSMVLSNQPYINNKALKPPISSNISLFNFRNLYPH